MNFLEYTQGFHPHAGEDDDLFPGRSDPFWDAKRKLNQMLDDGVFDDVDADTASEIVEKVATEEFDLDWDGSVKLWEWFEDTYDLD